jgi:hypothetical protein
MRRKISIAVLGILLLVALLLLVNWEPAQIGYCRWEFKSAEEAMSADGSPPPSVGWFLGFGDALTRYRRARQALLGLGYLQELVLRFPEGSDGTGLIQQCRKQFPDGGWTMTFDNSRHALRLTVPAAQVATWKALVSEFSAP